MILRAENAHCDPPFGLESPLRRGVEGACEPTRGPAAHVDHEERRPAWPRPRGPSAIGARERDWWDVERLLDLHGPSLDFARIRGIVAEFAEALGEAERIARLDRLLRRAPARDMPTRRSPRRRRHSPVLPLSTTRDSYWVFVKVQ
jgi:hypothetical protein